MKELAQKMKDKSPEVTKPITLEEVKKQLKRMANKQSAGVDNLMIGLFKYAPESIKSELVLLFNSILETRDVPDLWRTCNIFTIHKAGDEENPANYRPIALLCQTYKIFISIITERLTNVVEEIGVLSDAQSGFRRDRSTTHKLLALTNIIQINNKLGKKTHIAYLDIQKAYDSVETWGLKRLFESLNFHDSLSTLLLNIYDNNSARILTPGGPTDSFKISRGVKQGCPLSPLLFALFLEPCLRWLNSSGLGAEIGAMRIPVLAFADDLALVANTNSELQTLVDKVSQFFNHYGMRISVDPANRMKSAYTHTTKIREI